MEIHIYKILILESHQPLIRPSFSVCKYPFYKNPAKYQEFLQRNLRNDFDNETEFNALVDEVFYNKPEDFFHGFNIAPTYDGLLDNSVQIPVADPYVRIVLLDYLYNGFCAIVSYEALNKFVVDKGEVDANEQDFSFYNVFFLNVSKLLMLCCIIHSHTFFIDKGAGFSDEFSINSFTLLLYAYLPL